MRSMGERIDNLVALSPEQLHKVKMSGPDYRKKNCVYSYRHKSGYCMACGFVPSSNESKRESQNEQ